MKLNHIGLNIQRKEEGVDFYQNILGFNLEHQFKLSPFLAEKIFCMGKRDEVFLYKKESLQFELFINSENTTPGFTHICIEVKDREKIVKKCENAGYPVTRIPRNDKPDILFIRDKAGNIFELKN
ncbi:MAG: VOC family protein [Ignavibacteria bacterium]|nr:VOC family protein [Ignavibacteria bacterium]